MSFRERVKKLEKSVGVRRVQQSVIQDYEFRVIPTCPPSTTVRIQAGKTWRDASYWSVIGYNVEKPAVDIDLATELIVKYQPAGAGGNVQLDLNFTNPYHYKAITLGYFGDWFFYEQYGSVQYDYKYSWLGSGNELATASEAEDEIDLILNGGYTAYTGTGPYSEYQFLLWSFVLRNNGTITEPGQIMPIDPVNRGRSYMYRDMRPGKNYIVA